MKELRKNPFIKFLIIFILLVTAWFSLYKYIYLIDGSGLQDDYSTGVEKNLSVILGNHANFITELLGYSTTLEITQDIVVTRVTDFQFSHGTWIGEPCNGLKVMGLFAIFIIAYKGSWKYKIWFSIVGIVIIHFANAIRVSGLTIIEAKWPEYLDFNHNVTFQVLIYGIIFGMWYLWVQKFSNLNSNDK